MTFTRTQVAHKIALASLQCEQDAWRSEFLPLIGESAADAKSWGDGRPDPRGHHPQLGSFSSIAMPKPERRTDGRVICV